MPSQRHRLSGRLAFASVLLSGALAPAPAAAQPCDGQGSATLVYASPLPPAPGRRLAFDVTGAPLSPVAVAADLGPGPVERPGVGTICLDLGPRLRVLVDGFTTGSPTLDLAGRFSFSFPLPPRADVAGRTIFLQAFVRDVAAPSGIAMSPRVDLAVDRAFVENFSTTTRRDGATTTAAWIGNGIAAGVIYGARTVTVAPADTGFNLPDPFRTEGSRFQMLYRASEVGAMPGESIVGMSWGPRSNFVFAATYANTRLLLGLARFSPGGLALDYDSNYAEPPTRVFSGSYTTPSRNDAQFFPWPAFSTDFECDGTSDVVFEASVPASLATYQLFRNNWTSRFPVRRLWNAPGSTTGNAGGDALYHTRFQIARVRSIAQSTWLDTGIANADYRPAIVRTALLPAGTEVTLELEGAEDTNGDGLPEPGSQTGFTTIADALDGSRLVRFRLRLKGNLAAGTVPRVTAVVIPFR